MVVVSEHHLVNLRFGHLEQVVWVWLQGLALFRLGLVGKSLLERGSSIAHLHDLDRFFMVWVILFWECSELVEPVNYFIDLWWHDLFCDEQFDNMLSELFFELKLNDIVISLVLVKGHLSKFKLN